MPDLLLELFSEEIPARMQTQAAKDLERLVVGALSDRGLLFEAAKSLAGPRRLTLAIAGLPAKQPDVSEELKGPKVDAPQAALDGFLRKTALTKEQLKIETTPKGDVYIGVIARKGRVTAEVLSEILPETFAKLPWPKSMRFPGSSVRWVRPLHGIVCTFDGEAVPFEFAGVTSGNITYGHRFLSKGPIEVRRFEDYEEKLRKAHVILDAAERKEIIVHEARQKAFALGLEPVEDAGLLEEVAGLAEWPVVLIGSIEDEFMSLPPEILQTSMRTHQKYFALRVPPPQSGGGGPPKAVEGARLAPKFVLVANMIAEDGGKEIVAGNERVLRARLSDAKFFWDQDRKRTLDSRVDDLKAIVFHAKLGTQHERVERIEALAGEIADKIGADVTKAKRAARLCKADLTTGVVGEFPELQGVMGRYYALHDGEDADVADAIRDHYKPLGPNDAVPTNKVSIAVAMADKLYTVAAFHGVWERPTGSGDPYAVRRAALGLIRIILQNGLRIPLLPILDRMVKKQITVRRDVSPDQGDFMRTVEVFFSRASIARQSIRVPEQPSEQDVFRAADKERAWAIRTIESDFFDFVADRLKVALREKGTRHDLIDAVFSVGNQDDLVRLMARVEALEAFLKTDDGANLLAGYKRAANILKIEEKKDNRAYDERPKPKFSTSQEQALWRALIDGHDQISNELGKEDFIGAMRVMAGFRKPVDEFFDAVKVNVDDAELRKNRLELLGLLRSTLHLVADFSKIEG